MTGMVIELIEANYSALLCFGNVKAYNSFNGFPTCTNYTGTGPAFCAELGPIGNYTLTPGEYDVVVESISDNGTTPWTGKWELISGDEYYSCFFVVTMFGP